MTLVYAGGWDCTVEIVREWIARGTAPDAVFEGTPHDACMWAWGEGQYVGCDMGLDLAPDDSCFFVTEDGQILGDEDVW